MRFLSETFHSCFRQAFVPTVPCLWPMGVQAGDPHLVTSAALVWVATSAPKMRKPDRASGSPLTLESLCMRLAHAAIALYARVASSLVRLPSYGATWGRVYRIASVRLPNARRTHFLTMYTIYKLRTRKIALIRRPFFCT